MKSLMSVASMVFLLTGFCLGQQSRVYVDQLTGSDTHSGEHPANEPPGTGPVASINRALHIVADKGTIVVLAGSYRGGDWQGSDIVIDRVYAPHVRSGLSLKAQQNGKEEIVKITSGSLVIDIDRLVLTVGVVQGSESFHLAGRLILGSRTHTVQMEIPSASWFKVDSRASIVIHRKSSFSRASPEVLKK